MLTVDGLELQLRGSDPHKNINIMVIGLSAWVNATIIVDMTAEHNKMS